MNAVPAVPADALPTATAPQTRLALRTRLRPLRAQLIVMSLVLVAAAVAGLAIPPLLGAIVDEALDGSLGGIDTIVLMLLGVAAAQALLTGGATVLVARVGERFLATLREDVIERALALPLADVERAGTGDLVSRVGADVEAISDAVRVALPSLIIASLGIGLTVVGLALLDWRLALAGLLSTPIHFFATRWYLRRSRPLYARERIAIGGRAQQLTETIGGARTVRTLRLGVAHRARVADASDQALDRTLSASRTRARFFAYLNSAELVGITATLIVGFVTVRSGIVSVGAATAAALYFQRLFDPIGALLTLLDTAQDANAALARLVGVTMLQVATEPEHPPAVTEPSVELRGVSFEYSAGHPVVREVDLRVDPGTRIALVGPSGAGKTSLLKLVAGIHGPTAGTLALGGFDQRMLGAGAIRRSVVLVTQEVHVFSGTLAEDLRLARPDATDEQIDAALALSGAIDWVRLLPDGVRTPVGATGRRLSAMQAQQLALARIALTAAPIVVLDESTAEAGSAGARTLEHAALAVTAGRTTLVVAHRLTQAVSADRVAVVDGGRIVQDGTHDELVARAGPYAELWSAWSGVAHVHD
ncbi:ABC transporter ATP-binding protein [soil metagenome]